MNEYRYIKYVKLFASRATDISWMNMYNRSIVSEEMISLATLCITRNLALSLISFLEQHEEHDVTPVC